MYLKYGLEVLKEQLTILDTSEDFLFCPMQRFTRTDGTLIQMESMDSSDFHKSQKAIRQCVFSNTNEVCPER